MGGRGAKGAAKEITVSGYRISDGILYSPSGRSVMMGQYRELQSMAEKRKFERIGIKDPVAIGRMALSRGVAIELQRQQTAKAEREKATFAKNVPGLEKLRRAIEYDNQQRGMFRRSVESGSGVLSGNPGSNTSSAVAKQYPRASAYIKAESWSLSSNYVKAEYGEEAMKAIASGKSYKKAIADMERKWRKYVEGI